MSAEKRDHLIWSNEHHAWWRPEGRGYTSNVLQAGLYTEAEAKAREASSRGYGDRRPEEARPVSSVLDAAALMPRTFGADLPALLGEVVRS